MLNLILDPWIPVVRRKGPDVIRPDQMAEPDIIRLAWPRPDLNLACHELLIGLVYLSCPPINLDARRIRPDPHSLRSALLPLATAFNLMGSGPRFLQDWEPLEDQAEPSDRLSPDALFIDSAGKNTQKRNADLLVRRDRYNRLPPPLAAIALYTLQAFAPSGGKGFRTSMRGGGPMVTLVCPDEPGLWPMIWANVPEGQALTPERLKQLPWMKPCQTSEQNQVKIPNPDTPIDPEVFFGQPRRLRLIAEADSITGVIQKNYGINYSGWKHYLTPYRHAEDQTLPVHPKSGTFAYKDWRGIILKSEQKLRPENLERYLQASDGAKFDLIVSGWVMENAKPRDFVWSKQPVFQLSPKAEDHACEMVESAEQASFALTSFCNGIGGGQTNTHRKQEISDAFFKLTQRTFEYKIMDLSRDTPFTPTEWLQTMRHVALMLFDSVVIPGLSELKGEHREKAVMARKNLRKAFYGYGTFGKKIYGALGLELPARVNREAA